VLQVPDFAIYVHVPFCSVRCGYCDFNTYTATELGEGATRESFADTVIAELDLAVRQLGRREVGSVFFGGGTPTQLAAADLVRILAAIRDRFGLAGDEEVTLEANPDSVDAVSLAQLHRGGFTRISFGMQSAVPHVLAVLDRTHEPANVAKAVRLAREAGFEHISLDLIYGAPSESLDDWRTTVQSALALGPDHISAYALIVEEGTALARKVAHGEIAAPDDDSMADKYVLADEMFHAAGLSWYELSNWSTGSEANCRHNLAYWHGSDWWGVGPGAHSHVAGERWWNVKHPAAYASRLASGLSPRHDGETLDAATQHLEEVMLRLRLADGIEPEKLKGVERLLADGLLVRQQNRVVLTQKGRLLADLVISTCT
jgi:putative oxygen-independent coproporphyrinogen III oxidase